MSEYRPWVHGARDWLFPCLEHALHLSSRVSIDKGVRLHEDAVQVATEIDGEWSADVLDDAI